MERSRRKCYDATAEAPTWRRRQEAVRALPVRPSNARRWNAAAGSATTQLPRRRLGDAAKRPYGLCPCGRLTPADGTQPPEVLRRNCRGADLATPPRGRTGFARAAV